MTQSKIFEATEENRLKATLMLQCSGLEGSPEKIRDMVDRIANYLEWDDLPAALRYAYGKLSMRQFIDVEKIVDHR